MYQIHPDGKGARDSPCPEASSRNRRRCGHTWYSDILGEEELRYCPECGKETAVFDTWKEFSFEEYFGLEVDDSVEAEDYYDDDAIYVGDGDDPQER